MNINLFNNNFSITNKTINNNGMISFIDSSILVNAHEHPLKLCYNIERKFYGTGWTCNKCSSSFTYDIPSYYCTFCDFDLCQNCVGEYKLNEIKIYDTNLNDFKLIQYNSKDGFKWQKKYPFHSHLITNIKRYNDNNSWICNNCSKTFQNKDSSYYCSLCDFDICNDCFNKIFPLYFTPSNSFKKRKNYHYVGSHEFRKPVIYLYPEKQMNILVNLDIKKANFLSIYPKFNEKNNTWKVTAMPNGEIEIENRKYPYLFYEFETNFLQEMKEGFIVEDKNAINFLEEKLKILGLNEKEMTDFITYWLPVLIKNKLSICTFQTQKFFDYFQLNITPKPDSLIRIFITIKKIDSPIINIKEQKLEKVERKGFTVIEWGGANI